MRKIWAENRQEVLIFFVSIVLLIDVVIYGKGHALGVKILPILLALFAVLILLIWQQKTLKKVFLASTIFVSGYLYSLLVMNIKILNSDISYNNILGYKILGVPFLIGILWFVVGVSCWHIVNFGSLSKIYKYFLGVFIFIMFCIVLEQFATSLGLWSWRQGQVPTHSYFVWALGSALVFLAIDKICRVTKPSLFIASLLPILALYFWLMALF